MSHTLLFPGGMPEALQQLDLLRARGEEPIGASSLPTDPAKPLYSQWALLPLVTHPEFEAALLALVETHRISRIFTRHPVTGRFLASLIDKHRLAITLDASTFAAEAIQQQQSIFLRVDHFLSSPLRLDFTPSKPALSRLTMAAYLSHALRIEGQSSDEKLFALMEVFRSCPKGDIVEIGSFWGRSACLLALLSTHYAIGPLLCLDPWANDEAHQEGVPEHLNDEARDIDFASAHLGFLVNLLPYTTGHINFIRGDAHAVTAGYMPEMTVISEAFGTTSYSGRIACLHIDGNHDFAHVTKDIADWVPHVAPGGWIIVDDYQWAFGDGPLRAADTWMEQNAGRFIRAFVAGSALFMKVAD